MILNALTIFHVVLSLIGIRSGVVAIYGLLKAKTPGRWMQAFLATTALSAMAPTQSEPPFQIAQLAVLLLFAAIGIRAATAKPQRGLVP